MNTPWLSQPFFGKEAAEKYINKVIPSDYFIPFHVENKNDE